MEKKEVEMKRVIIESPYRGDIAGNLKYLNECIKDSLKRGEAPFASHGFYTWYLQDSNEEERKQGIQAGFAWGWVADLIAVYADLGVTRGMQKGILRAKEGGQEVVYRKILQR